MSCSNLQSIPDELFDYNIKVTKFNSTFNSCSNLQTIPVGLFDKCTKVTNFDFTYDNCGALTGETPYTLNDGVKIHLYERANYPEYFTAPTSNSYCFRFCSKLTDYSTIPSGWK